MTDSRDEHEAYGILPPVNEADIVPWLRGEADAAAHQPSPWRMLAAAADAIERLTAERDEARRELCAARRELCRNEAIIRLQRHRVHRDSEDVVGLAKEIAVERGWDCFKDHPSKLEISADEALKEMTRLDEEMGLL